MPFSAGEALNNKAKWLEDLLFLEEKGIPVQRFVKRAIHNGHLCYFEKFYFNKFQKQIRFNNKIFDSHALLVEEYKSKPEASLNYNGVREFEEECDNLVRQYVQQGVLREVTANEAQSDNFWISPLKKRFSKVVEIN